MGTNEVYVYGAIQAINAEIEAAKWDNQLRTLSGFTDYNQFNYHPDYFEHKAAEIRALVDSLFK